MANRVLVTCLLLAGCAPAAPSATLPDAQSAISPVQGQTGSAAQGAVFARERCASCHAIGRTGDSPNAGAPPLRQISQRYPVEQLQEAFAEGLVTTHPSMPEFVLSADENRDLIAYLVSIQESAPQPID